MLTSLKNNEKYVLIPPLLIITLEYAFNKCTDCQQFWVDTFECNTCKTIRCKFHHFVNSNSKRCSTCVMQCSFNILYNCRVCNLNNAMYGYEFKICKNNLLNNASNIIFYCAQHAYEFHELFELPIISYGQCCRHIPKCYSKGYFKDTKSEKVLCAKHAQLYENKYITYNYVDVPKYNNVPIDNIKEISVKNIIIIGGILGIVYYIGRLQFFTN